MNLNFRKTALFASICSALFLSYTPPVNAASTNADDVEAVQQTRKITGTVSDAMGPVIGANVTEKGTTNGMITDVDGNFTLNVQPGATIVISYIGYVTQEIKITNQTKLDITLKEDSGLLDEVVVIAYGQQKKVTITGAVSNVGSKELLKSPSASLGNALAGNYQVFSQYNIQVCLVQTTRLSVFAVSVL